MTTPLPAAPTITRLELQGYRAFRGPVALDLRRLTVIIGKNNSGKSALCFAPVFFTAGLAADAAAPFPVAASGVDFGSFPSTIYRRQATGLQGRLTIEGLTTTTALELGATYLPEEGNQPLVTTLEINSPGAPSVTAQQVSWGEARPLIQAAHLAPLADAVHALVGIRPPPAREFAYPASPPRRFDSPLADAVACLFRAGEDGLELVNTWLEPHLGIELRFDKRKDLFAVEVRGASGQWSNLVDSGAGVAQILPLVVAVKLAPFTPGLWCIEQPELHLHPEAHLAVADLLIEALERWPHARLIVETHSEALLLRLRRRIAEGERLSAEDVGVVFVDEPGAEQLRAIHFDVDGKPDYWPRGVFAEPQAEFFAIKRVVAARKRRG